VPSSAVSLTERISTLGCFSAFDGIIEKSLFDNFYEIQPTGPDLSTPSYIMLVFKIDL